MSITCEQVRGQLTWFVGGELDRDRAQAVAAHLARCLTCRLDAASLQQAGKLLAGAGAAMRGESELPGVDESWFEAMHTEITDAALRESCTGAAPGSSYTLWAAAAMLLFALGWWFVRPPEPVALFDRMPIPMATERGPAG